MAEIEVRLLGQFEVWRDRRPVAVSGNGLRVLFGVLAMAAGETVSVRAIGTALWGPVEPRNVKARLQVSIARLRRAIGEDVLPVVTTGYRLDVDPDAVDAVRFQRLCRAATAAAGTAAELDLVSEAVALWRGQPFAGIRSDWLDQTYTPRLTEQYLDVLERRIDLGGADLEDTALVPELSGLVERYPLRQGLWVRLLVALQRRGRSAEALRHYETVRRRLADELGVAPGVELRRIHADLLAGGDQAARARSATATRIRPRQVPSDTAGFVGRVEQVAALDQFVGRADEAVVAVHGSAGVGKTALVRHWAWRAADRFPDGQLFVDLRGYGPGEPMAATEALGAMLGGLGLPGPRIPAGLDARGKLFRETLAGRRILIVLDNARDADQVRPLLLDAGPVVLTSRNRLSGLEPVHRIGLDVLPGDDAAVLLADRLRRQLVSYDDDSLAALAELCDHLPLALTIAAERAGRDHPQQLADLIRQLANERDRLDLLATGEDLSSSLRAVMSWSCQALDAAALRLFRLLGLHPGTEISLPAAAALAGHSSADTRPVLDRLIDAHLVSSPRSGRFAMHDLVRMYAAEQASDQLSVEREAAVRRLYEWCARSAAAGAAALSTKRPDTGKPSYDDIIEPLRFDDERQAMAWFDTEEHVLSTVIADMRRIGQHAEVCQLIRAVCRYYFHLSRIPAEITALQELALESARLAGDRLAEAQVLNQLGVAHCRPGGYVAALSRFESAYPIYRQLRDAYGEMTALGNIGLVHWHLGVPATAIRYLERAIDIGRRHQMGVRMASVLTSLAEAYNDIGRYAGAEAAVIEAIELTRASGKRLEQAFCLEALGRIKAVRQDHARAATHYGEAAAIFRAAGSQWNLARALHCLGQAQHDGADPLAARASWEEALDILNEADIEDTTELSRADLRRKLSSAR